MLLFWVTLFSFVEQALLSLTNNIELLLIIFFDKLTVDEHLTHFFTFSFTFAVDVVPAELYDATM